MKTTHNLSKQECKITSDLDGVTLLMQGKLKLTYFVGKSYEQSSSSLGSPENSISQSNPSDEIVRIDQSLTRRLQKSERKTKKEETIRISAFLQNSFRTHDELVTR